MTYNCCHLALPLCGQKPTGASGIVTSPGFPSFYPNNLNCYIYIWVPAAYRARLVFTNFDLEEQDSCSYDSLEVFDGDTNESDKRFGKFCGSSIPPAVVSSTNELLLHFVSDDSTTGKGFRAHYMAGKWMYMFLLRENFANFNITIIN